MLSQPWKRQDQPQLIPDPFSWGALRGMSDEQFECLIRDNLQPVNNDSEQWLVLWRLLSRDRAWAERALAVLRDLEFQAEHERDHLADLTGTQLKRIKKFLRNIEVCRNKLNDDGQQRLAWAGTAGRFVKDDQVEIQKLVMAIDRHRAATRAGGRSETVDAQVWDAVDRAGVCHDANQGQPKGKRVTSTLVAAIREHENTARVGDASVERDEILWTVLSEVGLDPAYHYGLRQFERRKETRAP